MTIHFKNIRPTFDLWIVSKYASLILESPIDNSEIGEIQMSISNCRQ